MKNFPYKIFDLTHTLHKDTTTWSEESGFAHDMKLDYADPTSKFPFRIQHIRMHAGIGTHMDAPAHAIPGAATIDEIPLIELIVPCFVIDVSQDAHEYYTMPVAAIEKFEEKYGKITPNSFVMIKTGWEQHWAESERYRNDHLFPSVSEEAAQFLLARQIVGLGIDTLSPDRPEDGFRTHAVLLGAGKYIIENAANLHLLPSTGSYIAALPIKTKGGTEAPVRLIGFVKKESN